MFQILVGIFCIINTIYRVKVWIFFYLIISRNKSIQFQIWKQIREFLIYNKHTGILYWLCKKYQLKFGTPKNKDVNNFLLQPLFNFNTLVIDFLDSTQVIRCSNGHEFRYSEINQFRKYNMKCPICLESDIISNCKVIFKYTEIKKQFEEKEREKRL